MPTTPRGYRYPPANIAPNVPLDISNLATDVDADMTARVAELAASDLRHVRGMTRAARLALTGTDRWDGRVVFDIDWDQWMGWSEARSRWEFLADRIVVPTGTATDIGTNPTNLLNTTDVYAGLVVVLRNTANPTAVVEWVRAGNPSAPTWIELSRTGPWPTYTPTIIQGAVVSVPKVINTAKYRRMGNRVEVLVDMRITDIGAAGSQVQVTLPVTAYFPGGAFNKIGSCLLYDASLGQIFTGVATLVGGNIIAFETHGASGGGWGANPNVQLNVNDQIHFSISYDPST